MKETAKVAISLPGELLDRIEAERRNTGESRSEFVRRAVEALLRRARERELDEQYVRAYLEQPESPEEAEATFKAGMEVWLDNPWEEEEDTGGLRETG